MTSKKQFKKDKFNFMVMNYFDYNKSLLKFKILNLFFNDIVGGWTHKGLTTS